MRLCAPVLAVQSGRRTLICAAVRVRAPRLCAARSTPAASPSGSHPRASSVQLSGPQHSGYQGVRRLEFPAHPAGPSAPSTDAVLPVVGRLYGAAVAHASASSLRSAEARAPARCAAGAGGVVRRQSPPSAVGRIYGAAVAHASALSLRAAGGGGAASASGVVLSRVRPASALRRTPPSPTPRPRCSDRPRLARGWRKRRCGASRTPAVGPSRPMPRAVSSLRSAQAGARLAHVVCRTPPPSVLGCPCRRRPPPRCHRSDRPRVGRGWRGRRALLTPRCGRCGPPRRGRNWRGRRCGWPKTSDQPAKRESLCHVTPGSRQ